jgi:methyl-accepting chemotaxis protein
MVRLGSGNEQVDLRLMTLREFLKDESDLPFAGRYLAMKILAFGMVAFAAMTTFLAWQVGTAFGIASTSAGGFAILALLSLAKGDNRAGRSLLAQGMIGQCFSFTAAFAAHGWIIDTHMALFTICALVTVLVDVRALLVVVVSTVIHQVVLGIAYPVLVYPSLELTENLMRIVLHVGLFATEAVALMVVVRQRQRLFAENLAKMEGLRDAMDAERRISEERDVQSRKQDAFVGELTVALEHLAQGDLTVRLSIDTDSAYGNLARNFNNSLGQLSRSVTTALSCSDAIRSQIAEISGAADSLSLRSESQAHAIGDAAQAIGHLTGTVKQAAQVSRETAASADRARKAAHQSTEVAAESIRAMNAIQDGSGQIAKILSVIDDIAFQTNLLALNAGVEAARAGSAGRGFAVVAAEVRELAQRSSTAAKEISSLITASGLQVNSGVELVRKTVTELDRITKAVEEISTQIHGLASGADVQSKAVGEINESVEQLERTTKENATMLEETTEANRALNEMAGQLWDAMVVFKSHVAARARAA